ncbi:hypothetical protein FI667_g11683, partial [Globisporangium splendens]
MTWSHANSSIDRTSMAAMDEAARHGHLEVVKWLHANRKDASDGLGCSLGSFGRRSMAIDGAVANGHLHIVMWLHETCRLQWTHNTVCGATKRGHDHVVA